MFKNFVGIDVSKSKFDLALIKDSDKQNIIQSVFDNNPKGIKSMSKFLEKEHHIYFRNCFLHGIYRNLLSPANHVFVETECNVWLEMPVNIIRSLGLQRGKNDRIDAHRIALYAYKNKDDIKLWKPQRDLVLKLRDLLAVRERLISSKIP